MEYVMESTWTLRFSLLLKVLIDGCFVFSLLQHRVLPAAARAVKWQYQTPPRMYCFLVRTFTKHSRHAWSACELGYFTYVLCLGKNCWYRWSWAGPCAHEHAPLRFCSFPFFFGFFLSFFLSLWPFVSLWNLQSCKESIAWSTCLCVLFI